MIETGVMSQDEPKWTPYNRSTATDVNPYRKAYLESVGQVAISV
jgi:1,2-dihydroxy-3-keto-5-methylthiopentene dioxygenase